MNSNEAKNIITSSNLYIGKAEDIYDDLIDECKRANEGSQLTKPLREALESFPREIRREIVNKTRNGGAPLFMACKKGCFEIADYLVTVCDADVEQPGRYEILEGWSSHTGTPLWCAAASGKLSIVQYLISIGCNINATSDSGSTPVRSACFMKRTEIVQFLVKNGADINKANINGLTCLMNSVQSVPLCLFLITNGANIHAQDNYGKTALHYAIEQHRFKVTKLLVDKGADPYVQNNYGNDALQTACLRGALQIFDFLKTKFLYSLERLADSHELMGSTFMDKYNDVRVATMHWRLALALRYSSERYIEKRPSIPLREAFGNAKEFSTFEDLDNLTTDIDAMRIQSLIICERILGIDHRDLLSQLMFRGECYAELLHFQQCINIWRLALETRVNHYSILLMETSYTAQALVHLMLDLYSRNNINSSNNLNGQEIPSFSDVLAVFLLLISKVEETQEMLQIKPIFRKQQKTYDRILRCITHLIYLLICIAKSESEKRTVFHNICELHKLNVRSACTNDTLLHFCVSRLNVIKKNYFVDNIRHIFPNLNVIKILIQSGAEINAKNNSNSTPLHVACIPYNYENDIILYFLKNGANLEEINNADERPMHMIASNPFNKIPLMNFISLKNFSATVINKYRIPHNNQIPKSLIDFLKKRESK